MTVSNRLNVYQLASLHHAVDGLVMDILGACGTFWLPIASLYHFLKTLLLFAVIALEIVDGFDLVDWSS